MCADDAATRRHSRDTVVDPLLALTLAAPTTPPATPSVAMGAIGVSVVARVERLLFPPNPTRARVGLILALGGVLFGPVLAVGMTILVPMLCPV